MKSVVEARHIKYLYHFTNIKNVQSILNNGLLSRKLLLSNNLEYTFNDSKRYDGFLDRISCSIMWPNYKMFYKIRQENPFETYVVIRLLPDILWDLPCLFCPSNAASVDMVFNNVYNHSSRDDFIAMFADSVNGLTRLTKKGYPLQSFWPTDPQAEVLVLEQIPIKYISAIICESEEICKQIADLCKSTTIRIIDDSKKCSAYFPVECYMFGPRPDAGCLPKGVNNDNN